MSVFTDGVWGANAQHHNLYNGGPECASESTWQFKAVINLVLVSHHIFLN